MKQKGYARTEITIALSLNSLAEHSVASGIPYMTIWRAARGLSIRKDSAQRLADYLKLPVRQLFRDFDRLSD